MQIVDQAARNIGLQNDQVLALGQVLGQEAAAKLLHKLGTATSEATFVQGQQVGAQGPMTPDQAKVKRSELMRDASFTDRLFKGDPLARKQWDAVNQAVAPGEISL